MNTYEHRGNAPKKVLEILTKVDINALREKRVDLSNKSKSF